ncbi:hypothetical protein CYLTODRAFT_425303 [Cylindrobasidium torrendii FP15055 ss-10]|uniref:Uncharacterized protein n=1 Tax=Cylindrobasidium torrendii FP15055 ss-10 TaxID=1314674 RepID=A0A0D7B2E5_9AGAR|nr:hypothetical protein CYLTODRAFT_425303 [Cylindrobasidium torrendii FP15055 ss-10]
MSQHQRYHRSHPFICPYPMCQMIEGGKYHFDNLIQLRDHSQRWGHELSYVMSFNTQDIVQGFNSASSMGTQQPWGHGGHGRPIAPNDPAYTPGARQPTYYERQHRLTNEDPYRKAHRLRSAAPPPNARMIPKQEPPVHGVLAGRAAYMPGPSRSVAVSAHPHVLPKLEYDPEQAHRLLRK